MMKKHLSGTQKPRCGNLHPDEAALAWKEGRKKRRCKADKDENEAKLPHISSDFIYSASASNEVTVPSTSANECN